LQLSTYFKGTTTFVSSQAMVKDKLSVELSKPMVNCSTVVSIFWTGTSTSTTSNSGSLMGFISMSTHHGYSFLLNITCHVESLGMVHKVYFPAGRESVPTFKDLLVSKVVASLAPVRQT